MIPADIYIRRDQTRRKKERVSLSSVGRLVLDLDEKGKPLLFGFIGTERICILKKDNDPGWYDGIKKPLLETMMNDLKKFHRP